MENLAARMIKWLKVGGYVFFRESCFHQSGDSKRKYNPTHYREPRFYTKVIFVCLFSSFISFYPFEILSVCGVTIMMTVTIISYFCSTWTDQHAMVLC